MKRSPNQAIAAAFSLVLAASASGAVIWDGGDPNDDNWSSGNNWNGNVKPGVGDEVIIGSGNAVTYDDNGGNLPAGITLDLDGTLTNAGQPALRMTGSTITVGASGLITGGFWDLSNGTLIFDDGAGATMGNWENKGTNLFTFNMGATSFTTLTPGTFRNDGNNNSLTLAQKMALATYEVDFAAYTGGAGTYTLINYGSDATGLDDTTFQNANFSFTNLGAGLSADLEWIDATDSVVLNVAAIPEPTITGMLGLCGLGLVMMRRRN